MNFDSHFVPKLTDAIKFGVKLYTRNFDSINRKLRDGESLSVIENIVLKCLFIAYEHVKPVSSDLVVYRGTQNFTDIKNNTFISTSLSRDVAVSFMTNDSWEKPDCCLFTITIPKNSKCLPILILVRQFGKYLFYYVFVYSYVREEVLNFSMRNIL